MTTTIVSLNSATTLGFAGPYDSIVVEAGVNVAVANNYGVISSIGDDTLDVEGAVFGYYGFFDSATTGQDYVLVGSTGSIVGQYYGLLLDGGKNQISNNGDIAGLAEIGIVAGKENSLVNAGKISGVSAGLQFSGLDYIVNSGSISATGSGGAAIQDLGGYDAIINNGYVLGANTSDGILITGVGANVQNSGTISSNSLAISMSDGEDVIVNTGAILSQGGEAIEILGATGDSNIKNYGDVSAVNDGNSAIFAEGDDNNVFNSGTIHGFVDLAGNHEVVTNKGEIDGGVAFSGDYESYYGGQGSVEYWVSVQGAHGTFVGGADGTTFIISATTLAKTDTFVGQGVGTLEFNSTGAITATALSNVSGFKTLVLSAKDTIAITQNLVNTASGHALTVEAEGDDVINLASVVGAGDKALVWGQGGRNTIIAGASQDIFQFQEVADSTGSAYDIIDGVNFARDKFDIPGGAGSVKAIDAAVTKGALSTATFNADLANDLGKTKLHAGDAVLFTASAGTLKGDTFLVVDMNGTAGYSAGNDLVIRLVGASGSLTTGSFI